MLYANYQKEAAKAALKKNFSVMKQALDLYQAENGIRLTSNDLTLHTLKPILVKYLNVMYDCGYGASNSNTSANVETSCVKNYNNPDKNEKVYRTYNNKADIDLIYFDDGQFVLTDGTLVLLENNRSNVYISVDINGFGKKPNQLGKDLFMFQLDDKGELLPMGSTGTAYSLEAYCSNSSSSNMNGAGCTVKTLNEA